LPPLRGRVAPSFLEFGFEGCDLELCLFFFYKASLFRITGVGRLPHLTPFLAFPNVVWGRAGFAFSFLPPGHITHQLSCSLLFPVSSPTVCHPETNGQWPSADPDVLFNSDNPKLPRSKSPNDLTSSDATNPPAFCRSPFTRVCPYFRSHLFYEAGPRLLSWVFVVPFDARGAFRPRPSSTLRVSWPWTGVFCASYQRYE